MDSDFPNVPPYVRVRRIFGCGLDAVEFKRHYDLLSTKDRESLGKVAWRMMVADIVRLRIRLRVPFDSSDLSDLTRFNNSELPSLELFYLFGCLDTLAGPGHRPFPQWLMEENKKSQLNLGDGQIDVPQLIRIFETYQQQHGVGSRLRRLFSMHVLLNATIEWLLANAVIYRTIKDEESFLNGKNLHALTDTKEILDHWRSFFYELHRNPFAHDSTARDVFIPEDLTWAYTQKPVGEWESRSGTMHYRIGRKWWSLLWRREVDESLVLRVLVQGAALALMHIPVTLSTIDQFVRAQMRVRKFTGFRDEVDKNATNLELWTGTVEPGESHSLRLREFEFARLDTACAASVVDLFDSGYLREDDLRQDTVRYLESVREINEQMDAFHTTISAIADDADRMSAMIKFCAELRSTNNYAIVVDMPNQMRVIGRIDEILANPCHIYFTEF